MADNLPPSSGDVTVLEALTSQNPLGLIGLYWDYFTFNM
jgi:hypothetical protein